MSARVTLPASRSKDVRFKFDRREFAKRSSIVAVAILAFIGAQDRAAAQAFDLRLGTGNDQPAVFDFDGGHHACVYGYYGLPVPPFTDSSTLLLLAGGQNISFRLGLPAFLALQFSPMIGTCQRSETDPKHFTSASSAGR
jgi:hypothetical protein